MAASTVVKVGFSQMECGEDPKRNLARQLALAEQALKKGAKIFCTQELFRSQYFCQTEHGIRGRLLLRHRSLQPTAYSLQDW